MNKSEKIIIIAVVVVAIILVLFLAFGKKGDKFIYYKTKASKGTNTLIEDMKTFEKIASNTGIKTEIEKSTDFSKSQLSNVFNDEYFQSKKVAVIYTYEDTSKSYMYSVDNVEYNKEKTIATITYTDKAGEYLGPLKNSWYNCMLIELEPTVTEVSFVKSK